jgi:GTP-binding protein SAR1
MFIVDWCVPLLRFPSQRSNEAFVRVWKPIVRVFAPRAPHPGFILPYAAKLTGRLARIAPVPRFLPCSFERASFPKRTRSRSPPFPSVRLRFYGLLNSLGLYNKNAKILFLGLDNAGKTTLMHMLRDDRLAQHAPTQHATSEELQIAGVNFQAFDLGGHEIARKVWGDYFAKCDAVVYLVDSADRDRFGESRAELDALLSDDALAGVPFVILGNKVDLPEAASEDEIRYALGLTNATTGKGKATDRDGGIRPIEIYMCSVVRRMGFSEGFKWVAQYIK